VQLVWSECCGDEVAARAKEKEIKGWSRNKKIELIEGRRGMGKPFTSLRAAQGKGESSNG
jgi:predicted GIY-YIG superfamily endonuclease